MANATTAKYARKIFFYVFLITLTIVWMVPVITLVMMAIKSRKDIFSGISMFIPPKKIEWSNFSHAFIQGRLAVYMRNDLIISCLKVPLGIFIEGLCAFALTRLADIKHKKALFVFFLIGMMLPHQIALAPISIVFNRLHLINSMIGLFYVYIGFGISYGILILRGFFSGIPKAMDEAAYIEGCNKWQTFWHVIFPIAKPAIATLMITDFLNTWNEYLLASVIINDATKKTVPSGLMIFIGEFNIDYGLLCAGVLISIIPVIIVYLVFQRNFVSGMAGAVKG